MSRRQITSRLTYGNVMASMAMFVALGGSSYAALNLPKNSVHARQIATGAVRSSEVKNGTLLGKDFKSSELAKLRGAKGAKGDAGAKGDPGPTSGGYAQNTTAVTDLSQNAVRVLSLDSNGTGVLAPTFTGRLLVTATANIHSGVSTTSDAFCDIRVSAGGGPYVRIGATTNGYATSLSPGFDDSSITVTAGTDVAAGMTYDAAMFCESANGSPMVDRSQLTAFAVAR